MSKLYRSLLWSGLVVAGVAACGDDVTVAPPPNQGVQSVTVGPTGVTISVGQTLQMAAAVNADAGVATTVTWTSSNPATASVNPTSGLVTGVASGSVAITACSTVATGVCGQATVTVAATTPAVISIKSITFGTSNTPVNINNVAGQIEVTMNLDSGTQTVSSVDVLVDGAVACSQAFSVIQLATARAQAALVASDNPNAALVVEIQCSINTAEFNTTTGIAKFLNGAHQVSARVNLVGSAPKATPSTQLIFNNASGFVVTLTTSNGTDPGSAIDPRTGLQWLGGSVTLNFLGVSYVSGATISNISFPLFGKTVAAALTAGTGSVTFSEATAWLATNTGIGNYMSPFTGEPLPIGTAVLSNGTALAVPNAILNASSPPPGNTTIPALTTIRVDNVAPGATAANPLAAPQTAITQPLMTPVWVNATTSFAAGNATLGVPSLSTLNALTVGADVEEGVDAITVQFFATALGAALPSGCSTTGLTAITTGSQLAETTVSLSYRVRIIFKDALGNITCFSLAPGGVAGAQFGADFTAPTGTVAGPAAGPPGLNAPPGNFVVTASDNASGFDPAGGLLVLMTRVVSNTATPTCVIGSGTGCVTPAVRPLTFDATNGTNIEGYYTTTITLVDQAGNTTVLVSARLYELDVTLPAFSGGISLPSLIAGAATNTFTATVTDNLDLNTIFGDVTYPTAVLRYPSQSVGSWGLPLEQGPTTVNYAVANWIRCINAAGDFATTTNQPSTINLTVDDQALNAFSQASGAFGVNAQACGAVGAVTINSFIQNAPSYGTGLTQVDIDGASLAAASSTTVTLVAVADVPLNSAVDPFARVDFFYDNGGGVLIKIGTATAVLAQTVSNRTYTYTIVWNPDAAVPVGAVNVVALGVDAQGDAVLTATQVVTTVP
jgi:Bacterial surface proteins containing Ig-like domains